MKRRVLLFLVLSAGVAPAMQDRQGANQWEDSIRRFEAWDKQNAFPRDGVLFVGSSTIVRWQTREDFPDLPVINRGFGGSQMSDLVLYFDRVIKPYQPRVAVIYSGDNDMAVGKKAEQVNADVEALLKRFSKDLPATKVIVMGIKPSPSRWALWPEMKKANEMVRAACEGAKAVFVDMSPEMLAAGGEPKPELYVEDKLHMSAAGYKIWTARVRTAIDAAMRESHAGAHSADSP